MTGRTIASIGDLDALDFAKGEGTVIVVAQDAVTRQVLMVAYADREALERTLSTGDMHYRSRSRGLWRKGATSGHVQRVRTLCADCDGDTVLALVESAGPACHTGATTCFADVPDDARAVFDQLDATIAARAADLGGDASYTRRLLDDRNIRLKKVAEECGELVVALADDTRDDIVHEAADLYYHMMVALRSSGLGVGELREELERRRRCLPP